MNEQSSKVIEVYKVKISGPDESFIDAILATLTNAYKCYNISRPIPNKGILGVHQFVDIIREETAPKSEVR